MKRAIISIVILSAFCGSISGQKDSLLKILASSKTTEEMMKTYALLAFNLHLSNPDSTILLAHECINNSDAELFPFEKASCYNSLGLGYFRKGIYGLSLKAYQEAINYFEKVKRADQSARVYLNIAHVYQAQKDFRGAQENALKAIRQYEKEKDSARIAATYQVISSIHREMKNYTKAEEYLDNSIEILLKLRKTGEYATSLSLKGSLYLAQRRFADAEFHFQKSIELYKSVNDLSNQAIVYENLGETYDLAGETAKSIEYYTLALLLFEQLRSETDIAYEQMRLALPLAKLARYREAESYLTSAEAYFLKEQLYDYLSELYEIKSKVLQRQGKHAEALLSYERFVSLKDSLTEVQNKNEIIRLQTEFDAEKKEQQIDFLKVQQAKVESDLKNRNLLLYLLAISFAMLIVLILIWRKRLSLKQELKKQKMLNQIASDLHDDVGATISSVKMYGELIRTKAKEKYHEILPMAEKIAANSEEVIIAMSDIVWAIKPENNDIKSLQDRIFQAAVDLCVPKNIRIDFKGFETADLNKILEVEQKKDIYLILKEAINNAVKYAEAKNILIHLKLNKNHLQATVQDDGKGFGENWSYGNGLNNMKNRCELNQGKFQLETNPNSGSVIHIEIKLRHAV